LRQPEVLSHRPGRTVRGICGTLLSVAVINASIWGVPTARGRPGRGSSSSPSHRYSLNLLHHLRIALRLPAYRSDNQPVWRRGQRVSYFGFVVSEPLTNTIKNANASRLEVVVEDSGAVLNVCIGDNGIGGANPRGSGRIGLRDRVEAIGGSMQIISPAGGATPIQISLPIQQ
jgi:hypothetical protein